MEGRQGAAARQRPMACEWWRARRQLGVMPCRQVGAGPCAAAGAVARCVLRSCVGVDAREVRCAREACWLTLLLRARASTRFPFLSSCHDHALICLLVFGNSRVCAAVTPNHHPFVVVPAWHQFALYGASMTDQSIYVIKSEAGPLKVGIARRPADRMAELQRASGATLSLVHVEAVEDARGVEQVAHDLLRAARMHGEWFNTDATLAVQAIRDAVELVRNGPTVATSGMSSGEFRDALDRLNLSPYGAAAVLGVSLRTSHRYASGEQPISRTVALLLGMYLRFGIPS